MKKFLALLIATMLLLSAIPAMAANTRTSGLYTYEIKGNGTITITDFDWDANGDNDIFIPNMIDGYTVTAIGDEAFRYSHIIFDTEHAKAESVSVVLPESIKTIGDKAFWFSNISSIKIPDSVQAIGVGAFVGCESCQFIVSSTHPSFAVIDDVLYNKTRKALIACSWKRQEVYVPYHYALDIVIPEGISTIDDYALAYFGVVPGKDPGLTEYEITIPDTVSEIGNFAFYSANICRLNGHLSGVTKIGESAFELTHCIASELVMRKLSSIGRNAFRKAFFSNKISSRSRTDAVLDVGGNLTSIPDGAFDLSISVICTVANLQEIGNRNTALGELFKSKDSFSPELKVIPADLFYSYNRESFPELPETITTIEGGAYSVVTDYKLPSSLTNIDLDAFPEGSTFIVEAGSYAELWCSENGFGYTVEGQEADLSWLN